MIASFLAEKKMRLDKYLQVTGLIKRRVIANEACKQGLVKVNGVVARPTREVAVGDLIEISFAQRDMTIEVLKDIVTASLKKELRKEYFEILKDQRKSNPDEF